MSGFGKTTHFVVKINFEIGVLIKTTVTVLSVAVCCALIASSIPKIRLLTARKYTRCDCEKTGDYNFPSVVPNTPRSIRIFGEEELRRGLA